MELNDKLINLKNMLRKLDSVAIAYSGGVDSNFLLKVATDVLGENAIAVTLHAMMHSNREVEEAIEYAKLFKVRHTIVKIDDFNIKEFKENGPQRCYYCKKEIFSRIYKIAKENNIKYVLDGTNLDDLNDYRPGLKAIKELNIISPLKECRFTKEDIRTLSKQMGLNTFNKPAFACLATRIPCGTKITNEKLRMIEKSEDYLYNIGLNQFRVRLHNDIARIEVGKDEIYKFFINDLFDKINNKLKEFGFKYVTLDMGGYKMGSTNIT